MIGNLMAARVRTPERLRLPMERPARPQKRGPRPERGRSRAEVQRLAEGAALAEINEELAERFGADFDADWWNESQRAYLRGYLGLDKGSEEQERERSEAHASALGARLQALLGSAEATSLFAEIEEFVAPHRPPPDRDPRDRLWDGRRIGGCAGLPGGNVGRLLELQDEFLDALRLRLSRGDWSPPLQIDAAEHRALLVDQFAHVAPCWWWPKTGPAQMAGHGVKPWKRTTRPTARDLALLSILAGVPTWGAELRAARLGECEFPTGKAAINAEVRRIREAWKRLVDRYAEWSRRLTGSDVVVGNATGRKRRARVT